MRVAQMGELSLDGELGDEHGLISEKCVTYNTYKLCCSPSGDTFPYPPRTLFR